MQTKRWTGEDFASFLQTQIDVLCDKLDRNSAHYERDRRERDEIRAEAVNLIQQRDALRSLT